MDGIELKGSVVLDEETLEKLKVKIREEVIEEIKQMDMIATRVLIL